MAAFSWQPSLSKEGKEGWSTKPELEVLCPSTTSYWRSRERASVERAIKECDEEKPREMGSSQYACGAFSFFSFFSFSNPQAENFWVGSYNLRHPESTLTSSFCRVELQAGILSSAQNHLLIHFFLLQPPRPSVPATGSVLGGKEQISWAHSISSSDLPSPTPSLSSSSAGCLLGKRTARLSGRACPQPGITFLPTCSAASALERGRLLPRDLS